MREGVKGNSRLTGRFQVALSRGARRLLNLHIDFRSAIVKNDDTVTVARGYPLREVSQLSHATLVEESDRFNQTLLDCVDDAVRAIMGEEVLQSLFVNLGTYQGLSREEIPFHLDVFFPALEKAFGQPSGRTVGRFIIKVLYARLGLEFDSASNRVLLDYVEDARRELGEEGKV